ncbi:hypothetical protein G6F46_011302 [Rhizopus delemar]|nr:hypothetical protein G6F55_010554 [Rhizopus delemar]KAG1535683.1 hypothetical protein G6F51_011401 [Rhizopus arrhizus]KAG1490880.1 hypothetical protein G6F54_010407 [Rhizopus delemar]KAG1508472.1 hypothetical protein G6F53_008169 [Rhizopus delemar]KAG1518130.1 hypothetical protein G6F52_009088 [Rhizopus delemar]
MALPTEWANLMKSDVVYAPISHRDRDLPPILVEIQHTMNMKFYLRVNEYCLQILKEYPVAPIVVVVCINSTTQDIIDMETNQNLEFPFAVQLPCPGWAKSFHLFNGGSIHAYLNTQPLHPLVAVAHFLIEQKLSLISMQHRQDPIIQQLFGLAKDSFGTDIEEYENLLVVLQQVCNQTNSQFSKANKRLLEDVEDPDSRKRTAKCLDDGILYVNEICRKHHITAEPLNPSLNSSSVGSSSSSTSSRDFLPAPEHKNLNWAFIDSVRKHLKDKMDWEDFFQIGKDIGLFSSYNSSKSANSA